MAENKKASSQLWALLLLALFFFVRKKKGFGTTLFGVGTKLDLKKPIEDVEDFIKASKEENQRGFTGSIKPKGIYYQLKAGDIVYSLSKVTDSTCSDAQNAAAEKMMSMTLTEDVKIYNPTLEYIDEGNNSKFLPPYIFYKAPSAFEQVIFEDCSYTISTQYTTASRADYSRFGKTP